MSAILQLSYVLSLCYLFKCSDIPFCPFSSSPFIVVPFWIVILPNGSRLFFYPKLSFFTLNPVFYPKLSFSQSDQNLRRRSVWSHNAEKTSQADTFCIYSVYILYIFCTYLPPHHDLGGTQQSIIRTPRGNVRPRDPSSNPTETCWG